MSELSHKSERSKGDYRIAWSDDAHYASAQQQNLEASSQEITEGDEMRVCGTHTACPSSFGKIARITID